MAKFGTDYLSGMLIWTENSMESRNVTYAMPFYIRVLINYLSFVVEHAKRSFTHPV